MLLFVFAKSLTMIVVKFHRNEHIEKKSRKKVFLFLLTCFLSIIYISEVDGSCREENVRDCESICTINTMTGQINNCTVRALVLLPDDDYYISSLKQVLPILKVAAEYVRDLNSLPPYINFEWIAKNDKCDPSLAVINAMDGIVKDCAHVIFGPICDYSLGMSLNPIVHKTNYV